jgi:threonine/homoserine/homoserine lactone efflux protein
LAGLTFGLSAGLAPGPLMTLIITQTLRHNVKEGVLVALAPLLTDVPIILLAYVVLQRLSAFDPMILGGIGAVGAAYVLYLSWETIRTGPVLVDDTPDQARSLMKGALVNALNPHPYLFWATVGVPFMLKTRQESPMAMWSFVILFYILLVGSKVAIAVIVGRLRTFLEGRWYRYVMRTLGVLLAVFALFLLWDALHRLDVISI